MLFIRSSNRGCYQLGSEANIKLLTESSTRQLSAFHSPVDNEEQQPVREARSEDNGGSVDDIAINETRDNSTAIENTLPQLPSLNFSENEMCITDKSTATDTDFSNGTAKPSLHARKSSAPSIPRKSSKRQSALNKTSRRRSPTKESQSRRFPKGPIIQTSSGLDEQSHLIVSPSDPNAINASVAQTFKAMEELKPGSTNTLVVEKKRRLKAGAFLKVKNVLQGSFRRRKNDNSQENHLVQPPFVNSPTIQEQPGRRPESLSGTNLRLSEGSLNDDFFYLRLAKLILSNSAKFERKFQAAKDDRESQNPQKATQQ